MFSTILRKLKSQKGAMDRILVTLILTIIAISAVVGVITWYNDQKATMQNEASNAVTNAFNAATE